MCSIRLQRCKHLSQSLLRAGLACQVHSHMRQLVACHETAHSLCPHPCRRRVPLFPCKDPHARALCWGMGQERKLVGLCRGPAAAAAAAAAAAGLQAPTQHPKSARDQHCCSDTHLPCPLCSHFESCQEGRLCWLLPPAAAHWLLLLLLQGCRHLHSSNALQACIVCSLVHVGGRHCVLLSREQLETKHMSVRHWHRAPTRGVLLGTLWVTSVQPSSSAGSVLPASEADRADESGWEPCRASAGSADADGAAEGEAAGSAAASEACRAAVWSGYDAELGSLIGQTCKHQSAATISCLLSAAGESALHLAPKLQRGR